MDQDLADLLPAYYYIPLRCGNQNSDSFFRNYQSHYLQHNASTPLWSGQPSSQSEEIPVKVESFENLPSKISLESLYERLGKNSAGGSGKCNEEYIRQLMKDLEFLNQEVSTLQEWKKNMREGLTTIVKKQNELIEEHIELALNVYSADEIGLMDYAALYSGGTIESLSKDTQPFPTYKPWSLFKLIHFDVLSNPEEILKTSTLPGSCFAFQGSKAVIKIRLAGPILIGSVTIGHASKLLLGEEGMRSSPKDFQVYGFYDKNENNAIFLGEFSYNIQGNQHQTFIIDENIARNQPFQYVQVNILNNHGKEEFTCLYRFRVHGQVTEDFSEQKMCPGCKKHKRN